jgi:hypothetical protein
MISQAFYFFQNMESRLKMYGFNTHITQYFQNIQNIALEIFPDLEF